MGNREALLKGALECLFDKGYANTTARDIAGRAQTSLAAIGYHFGSTDQLLHEAIADGFRLWRDKAAAVLGANAGGTPEEVLGAVGDELAKLFEEQRPLLIVFMEALSLSDRAPEVQSHAATLYREERQGIAALLAAARGEVHADDEVVASVLQAVVDGLIVQSLVGRGEASSPRDVLIALAPLIQGTNAVVRSDANV